jgi:hypothetical protein
VAADLSDERASMKAFWKKYGINSMLVFGSILLGAALVEVILRVGLGIQPLNLYGQEYFIHNKPLVVFEPDLGWDIQAGQFEHVIHKADIRVQYTFPEDGRRISSPLPLSEFSGRPKILLIGDSITMGVGVSDQETMGWRLQKMLPDYEVINLGVVGYGTVQSYLKLKKALQHYQHVSHVVYSFYDDHENRNFPTVDWLLLIGGLGKHSFYFPYAQLNKAQNDIQLKKIFKPSVAFVSRFALSHAINRLLTCSAFVLKGLSCRRAFGEIDNKGKITKLMLGKMQNVSDAAGITLHVPIVDAADQHTAEYMEWLKSEGISTKDCRPDFGQGGYRVPVDGHPNGRAHAHYAECIHDMLFVSGRE